MKNQGMIIEKKRNLCVAFARRTKQQYFPSLDLRLIAGNNSQTTLFRQDFS